MLPWLLGIGFGMLGVSRFIIEYASAFRVSASYRSSYVRERLNYLVPLYLIGAVAVFLTLVSWTGPWYRVYVSYVVALGLTVGGRVFLSRASRGFVRVLDVYDLDLDLPMVSMAVSLIPVNAVFNVVIINLISSFTLFLETVVMYVRASRKLFDVGRINALIYSLPLLVIALYALYESVASLVVFMIALFILALFIINLMYLILRGT
ncbi:hypothetical protein [Vulcanisaeta souniana]|uniref:Uncharacterized protein n=2 Tax=Vulcanisaeta souniana JCM 11219 TaxID=1293586 RepID=A0ABM8BK38_9CREN|nr:hypothetical protein [Vulcanisaeta souniana]BDR91321.1 hypothetical protein Vsou_04140 [Vulcanisaeta souniana JCM 11219]